MSAISLWLGILVGLAALPGKNLPLVPSVILNNDSLQILALNKEFSEGLRSANLEQISRLYAADAVAMPEYHSRVSKSNIQLYFKQWLSGTSANQLTKHPYRVISSGSYVIETGYFTHGFNRNNRSPFSYEGKYVQVWRKEKNQQLKLVSQIWGSTTWFDKKELPDIVGVTQNSTIAQPPAKDSMYKQFDKENQKIAGFVKQRAGHLFAEQYTNDAIYMPYYSSMVIGKDSIHRYYIKHEDPNVGIDSVSIHIARVLPGDSIYIVDGVYSVNWRSGGNTGLVNGKSINIWRKEPGGRLLLHWQMTNHDF